MKFVEQSEAYLDAYRDFAVKMGGGSSDEALAPPFGYYGLSPGITVKRRLLIDDAVDPPIVVGAVNIKIQDYVIGGKTVQIAVATYPVSLGLIEPRYAMAGLLLFRKLAETYPLNLLLGMGPPDSNVTAKMCALLGWSVRPIPYLFLPIQLGPLAAKQLAGRPGLARLARLAGRLKVLWPLETFLRLRAHASMTPGLWLERTPRFGDALDVWWRAYAGEVGFSLVRDARQINAMFPETIVGFEKLAFYQGDRLVGFAVLLVPDPQQSRLRFGFNAATLVEFSLLKEHVDEGASALAKHLFTRRFDAVIANTPLEDAVQALKAHGFRERRTHVYLATSRALQNLLDDAGVMLQDMLITRGDGDGPIGLGVDFS